MREGNHGYSRLQSTERGGLPFSLFSSLFAPFCNCSDACAVTKAGQVQDQTLLAVIGPPRLGEGARQGGCGPLFGARANSCMVINGTCSRSRGSILSAIDLHAHAPEPTDQQQQQQQAALSLAKEELRWAAGSCTCRRDEVE